MRPCQLIVAVSVDERSLQKRLFEVTGCRDHGPGNRHSKGNARALYLEHYFTPVKIARDSNLLCRRKWHPVYFRTGRRAPNSYKFTGSLPALWEQKKKDEKARETIYITLSKCVMRYLTLLSLSSNSSFTRLKMHCTLWRRKVFNCSALDKFAIIPRELTTSCNSRANYTLSRSQASAVK